MGVLLAINAGWLLVNDLGMQQEIRKIQIGMVLALTGALLYLLILNQSGRCTAKAWIQAIMFMGCVMRIGYMLYTPVTIRCHDLFELDVNTDGKAGYLLRWILEQRLPESNALQLYQQPLFYITGGWCSQLLNGLLGRTDTFSLVDASKVVSCAASCISIFIIRKLFEAFHISEKSTAYGMLLISFTPVFYLTGGRLGENALSTMFVTAALLYTLYWEKTPDWKYTILLAVFYGLGMLTKISMAVPALFTFFIFVKKITENRIWSRENRSIYGKLLVFGGISLPLGLWFSVRNRILFGQSLTYVLRQSESQSMYAGNTSWMQRFLIPDIQNLFYTPYAEPYTDKNLFVYLLKSELFGEAEFAIDAWIPVVLLFLNLVLTMILLGYFVYLCFFVWNRKGDVKILQLVSWMVLFSGFAVYSYWSYPFGCTMDFRYYMMLTVCKALLLGRMLEGEDGFWQRYMVKRVSVCFGIVSCLMYCLIGL